VIHAISGWLTRHARRNRDQLARDHAVAAANGWQARPVSRLGTWQYREPRFDTRTRTIPLAPAEGAGKRCAR
jgi:hypothetical protein